MKEVFILIGEIVSAVGIRGEVKIKSYADDPSRFGELDYVFLRDSAEDKKQVEKARSQGNMAIVKLLGIDDRNAAEDLKGTAVYIEENQLAELPDDTYYVRDLIGLSVYKAEDEGCSSVGRIKDVLQSGPQDIYVLDVEGRDVLVPVVKEFIKEVHINKDCPEEGYVKIKFIEGML